MSGIIGLLVGGVFAVITQNLLEKRNFGTRPLRLSIAFLVFFLASFIASTICDYIIYY